MSETMDDAIARVPHTLKSYQRTSMTSPTIIQEGIHADDCIACALARARAAEKEQVERLVEALRNARAVLELYEDYSEVAFIDAALAPYTKSEVRKETIDENI